MFTAFYRDYVVACAELGITPLSCDELAALLDVLVEQPGRDAALRGA